VWAIYLTGNRVRNHCRARWPILTSRTFRTGQNCPNHRCLERSNPRSRAKVVEDAFLASRLSCRTNPSPVKNQSQAEVTALRSRHHLIELHLDLHRIGLFGQLQQMAQSGHMGVHRQTGLTQRDTSDNVGSFASDAGKLHEVLHRRRHLAIEFGHQHPCHANQALGLLTEQANRVDVWLHLFWIDLGQRPRIREPRKQFRCGLVDPDIGRLGRQDCGGQKFERISMVELANGIWILDGQALMGSLGSALGCPRSGHGPRHYRSCWSHRRSMKWILFLRDDQPQWPIRSRVSMVHRRRRQAGSRPSLRRSRRRSEAMRSRSNPALDP